MLGEWRATEKTETWEVCESATILIDLDANVNIWIKKDGETLPLEKYIEKIIEKYISENRIVSDF